MDPEKAQELLRLLGRGAAAFGLEPPSSVGACDVEGQPIPWVGQMLARTGDGLQLHVEEHNRAELLKQARAGELTEVLVTARTYLQQEGKPNANFTRVRDGAMLRMARSGKGNPFLVDHAWREQARRGGTVATSTLERTLTEDGGVRLAVVQGIKMVKPWAIESVLDGTIDRFSVGWVLANDGTITCTECGEDVLPRWWAHKHFPGDASEKNAGGFVEWEFTAAELVEVSGVNVPAVSGTGVDEVRAALAAMGHNPNRGGSRPTAPARSSSMDKIRQLLGLPESASDAEVAAAIEKRERDAALSRARLTEVESTILLVQEQARAAQLAAEATKVDGDIAAAYQAGKLIKARGQASPMETLLRRMATEQGYQAFSTYLASLPRIVPVGSSLAASTGDPTPPTELSMAGGDLLANPHLGPMLERFGITIDDVKKSGVLKRIEDGTMFGRLDRSEYRVGDDLAAPAGRER